MRNQELKHAIDQAKRAQLDAQGGYRKVEDDAQGHDRFIRRRAGMEPPLVVAQRPGRRKLTETQIAQARAMRASGSSYKTIAIQFGVHLNTIAYWVNPSYQRRCANRDRHAERRSIA